MVVVWTGAVGAAQESPLEVLATKLARDVSITLVREPAGWRFGSWTTGVGLNEKELPAPPADDVSRWFGTSDEALLYFRRICPTSRFR